MKLWWPSRADLDTHGRRFPVWGDSGNRCRIIFSGFVSQGAWCHYSHLSVREVVATPRIARAFVFQASLPIGQRLRRASRCVKKFGPTSPCMRPDIIIHGSMFLALLLCPSSQYIRVTLPATIFHVSHQRVILSDASFRPSTTDPLTFMHVVCWGGGGVISSSSFRWSPNEAKVKMSPRNISLIGLVCWVTDGSTTVRCTIIL